MKKEMLFLGVFGCIMAISLYLIKPPYTTGASPERIKIQKTDNNLNEQAKTQLNTIDAPVYYTPLSHELENHIRELAIFYGISPEIAFGLIEQESNFNPYVVSDTNDYGLMQINISNHEWLKNELGLLDIQEPFNNVEAGMYLLGQLKAKYGTDHSVLMAYNMGEGGAKQLWDRGIYTSDYSCAVIEKSEKYR